MYTYGQGGDSFDFDILRFIVFNRLLVFEPKPCVYAYHTDSRGFESWVLAWLRYRRHLSLTAFCRNLRGVRRNVA